MSQISNVRFWSMLSGRRCINVCIIVWDGLKRDSLDDVVCFVLLCLVYENPGGSRDFA